MSDQRRNTRRAMTPRRRLGYRLARRVQKSRFYDWRKHRGTWRHRIIALLKCSDPWWDWGHRLMIFAGDDHGGNWSEPEPPTWWYRQGPPSHMVRTGYPRHPLSTFEVIKGDYDEFRHRTDGLNPDDEYAWRAICVDQDGQLQLGRRYWGQDFYGIDHWEVRLLRKYLRMWNLHTWWGIRPWLYKQGLHAAVHKRKPRSCQQVPPRDTGGYDHWHCRKPRGHDGLHRFNNYVWGDVGGEHVGTVFQPREGVDV